MFQVQYELVTVHFLFSNSIGLSWVCQWSLNAFYICLDNQAFHIVACSKFKYYSFSNSACSTFLTSSIVCFSKSVLLSSSSAVKSNTLLAVSQPTRFNSSITQVSISSLNSYRSISNSSTSPSLSR